MALRSGVVVSGVGGVGCVGVVSVGEGVLFGGSFLFLDKEHILFLDTLCIVVRGIFSFLFCIISFALCARCFDFRFSLCCCFSISFSGSEMVNNFLHLIFHIFWVPSRREI